MAVAGEGTTGEGTTDEAAQLVAAMEQVAQGPERARLQKAMEGLAKAEQEVGDALRELGLISLSHNMLERATRHFQEAAEQARALADLRTRKRNAAEQSALSVAASAVHSAANTGNGNGASASGNSSGSTTGEPPSRPPKTGPFRKR